MVATWRRAVGATAGPTSPLADVRYAVLGVGAGLEREGGREEDAGIM